MAPASGETRTTCPYCGVGCGVLARRAADGTVAVRGDPDHPANAGRLCSKGSALGETVGLEDRLLHPTIGGTRAPWDAALDHVAARLSATIAEHGPDAVAFYVSGQLLTEDYYVANKLMKGFIGSANIDTNSRLCMASSVAGHVRAFGADTVPGTYEDIELADLVVLVGSNLAWCHPVLHQRLAAAKAARPALRVVLIDPRRTASAELADLHLAIAPDGDTALFCGLLAHLAREGAAHHDYLARHVTGMADAIAAAGRLGPSALEAATGLDGATLARFYALFARHEKVVTLWSQGVNQSAGGTDKVNAIINCHLLTGRIGRPGMGPFSITGQPNAMGGREVGGLATMLAAHMRLDDADHRALVQRFWQSPRIADRPGLKAVELFHAIDEGRVKALWVMSTNPAVSMPEGGLVRRALARVPFLVVSDIHARADTLADAHVVLPSTGWGEKDGTVTNSERRISRQRAFLPAPGEARPDWWQLAQVGCRMGFADAFAWPGPAAIFAEHAALSAHGNDGTRDFDIGAHAAITPARYDTLAPFQWPLPAGAAGRIGAHRFFAEGGFFTPDRRARAVPVTPPAIPAPASGTLTLNSGRIRDQWHTMTRTGRSARLSEHLAEPFCEIHPHDALRLGLGEADMVRLSNERGSVLLRALLTDRVRPGELFAPMHWSAEFAPASRIGTLFGPERDPHSGQPALKRVAVNAAAMRPAAHVFALLADRPPLLPGDYAALARAHGGWRLEAAFVERPSIDALAAMLVPEAGALERVAYDDRGEGQQRLALFGRDGALVAALFLSPAPVAVARAALAAEVREPFASPRERWRLAAGRPGAGRPDPGATVCACFGVGINTITADIAAATRAGGAVTVEAVGERLKAGTNCGSCRAEIRGLIHAHRLVAAE